MLASQVLRSTASISQTATVASKSASKILLRASHKRIGEAWIRTEARRLVPAFLGWSAFMTGVLGWPFAYRKLATSL
ncbi:LAFE_0H09208g1_1 [Lachancea fermentati]|uniref:LAFE_0H09208g1_1 n=1 Tax=Lachancea fermentati TaxID=4955 RepID=A0A1G4MK33_LACFM|nr:LAFE_0H09208g1_1 [Lachancea fermentati]